jgi:hypothetical protein
MVPFKTSSFGLFESDCNTIILNLPLSLSISRGTHGSVASLLAATLYHRNPDRNQKLWNIVSSERYILHIGVP